ncbi:MAG: prenyltransferase [candidate division WOR-3 bacterium]|nr:MAG: prenyltransferase [candidate division WOR-3 bacterium]
MTKIQAWLALSRLPFHTVGVLPFILGTVLAYRTQGMLNFQVLMLGTIGVILIMLSTYYGGEYWDYVEDTLSARNKPSKFAGGSRVLQKGILPRRAALSASIASLSLALVIGIVLQFVYRTGAWTLPFGVVGMFAGFFYSARPIRWVRTGLGELLIALCYGWLPLAVSYYLQAGNIASLVHWMSIPVGLTIFNVILLNEYPDYDADRVAGKRNVLVRLGTKRGAYIYSIAGIGGLLFFFLSLYQGVPSRALWLYLPVAAVSMVLTIMVLKGRWQDRDTLEKLCGANILVNLGTTASYILAFV